MKTIGRSKPILLYRMTDLAPTIHHLLVTKKMNFRSSPQKVDQIVKYGHSYELYPQQLHFALNGMWPTPSEGIPIARMSTRPNLENQAMMHLS